MKAMITLYSLPITLCLVFSACHKDAAKTSETITDPKTIQQAVVTELGDSPPKSGWQPEGTTFTWKGENLQIKGPDGWSYIGYDPSGNVVNRVGTVIEELSCRCRNGSGRCSPFKDKTSTGTVSGCIGGCNNCSMTRSLSLTDKEVLLGSGGFYNETASVQLLKPGDEAPAVFDALINELPAFKEQLLRFLARAHLGTHMELPVKNPDGSVSAPPGYSLMAITILGRGLVTVVPEDFAKAQAGYAPAEKAHCTCSQGSCKLTSKPILGTAAMYCSDGCTGTCTLTTITKGAPSSTHNLSLITYSY